MGDYNQTANSSIIDADEVVVGDWYTHFIVLYIILTILMTAGNVLTMAAYWITPHLQTPPNLLIFNLSLVDSCVGYLCLPWMILNYTEAGLRYVTRSRWSCAIGTGSTISSITASLVAILAMSLERFVAILFPYRYYTVITDRSVRVIIAFTWLIPPTLTTLPLICGWNVWESGKRCFSMYVYHPNYNLFLTIIRTLLIVVMAVMNICIAVVAARKSKEEPATSQAPEGKDSAKVAKFNWKLTKMMLTVVGVFYACWLPFTLLTVLYNRIESAPRGLRMAHDFAKLLIGLNSAVNPLIYAKSNSKFGEAFKKILSCKT